MTKKVTNEKVYEIRHNPDGGWMGSNYRYFSSVKDFVAALRAEFKENGIKGVTVSGESCGGRSIRVKFTPKEEDFTPLPEYLAKMREPLDFMQFSHIEHHGKRITSTEAYNLPAEERYALYDKLCTERYNLVYEVDKYGIDIDVAVSDDWRVKHWLFKNIFAPQFVEKMQLVQRILDSYNYDQSDIMADYFDRGFYDSLRIMPRKQPKTA